MSSTAPVAATTAALAHPQRWAAAIIMAVAALMDLIDVTIVNVALPTIRGHLHASATQIQWVVSGYLLAFAVLLITGGRMGDLFGRKRVFQLGVALFGVASLMCAIAGDPEVLIAARVAQGVAAAVMVPQVLATYRVVFAGKERGQAFAVYGAISGFAAAIGLIAGGVLTQADLGGLSWRLIFLINVPIALLVLALASRAVPEMRDASAGRIDVSGTLLLIVALVAVVYPLLEGRELGWPLWNFGMIVLGVVAIVLLLVLESRRHRPDVTCRCCLWICCGRPRSRPD